MMNFAVAYKQAVVANDVGVSLTEQGDFTKALQYYESALRLLSMATDIANQKHSSDKLYECDGAAVDGATIGEDNNLPLCQSELEQNLHRRKRVFSGLNTIDIASCFEDSSYALLQTSQRPGYSGGELFLCRLSNCSNYNIDAATLTILGNMSTMMVLNGRVEMSMNIYMPRSALLHQVRKLQRASRLMDLAQHSVENLIENMPTTMQDPVCVYFLAAMTYHNHTQTFVQLGQIQQATSAQGKAMMYLDNVSRLLSYCDSSGSCAKAA
jgi:tetratricopeptide (TPR) repeat protein